MPHPLPAAPDADLLALFLQHYDVENTARAYRADLQAFFGSEGVTLDQARAVSFVDVNCYIERLQTGGAAPATVDRKLASTRGFFEWLRELGAIDVNPAARSVLRRRRRPDRRGRIPHALTRPQVEAILDAIGTEGLEAARNRALILLLVSGCLRRGEATALDFEHIQRVGEHPVLHLDSPKGGTPERVKASPSVAAALRALQGAYVREGCGGEEGPIFRALSNNHWGARLSTASVWRTVRQAGERVGIEGLTPHDLRHTGCTLAFEGGASIPQVQRHARHRRVETTMRYVHLRDEMRHNAADHIGL